MAKLSLKGRIGTQWGLGGGLIASLCCLGPTVAALFGLTGATFLFSMFKYRPYFLAAGGVFMVAGIGLALRRSRQTCDAVQHRRNQWLFPAAALLSFGVSYGVLTYVTPSLVSRSLTPAAAESQPAKKGDNYAPVVLPAQVTIVAPDAVAPEGKKLANSAQTSAQPEAAAVSPPEVQAPEAAPAGQAAGPRRAALAIQGMS